MFILNAIIFVFILCWLAHCFAEWLDRDYAAFKRAKNHQEAIRKYGSFANKFETMLGLKEINRDIINELADKFAEEMFKKMPMRNSTPFEIEKQREIYRQIYLDEYKYSL